MSLPQTKGSVRGDHLYRSIEGTMLKRIGEGRWSPGDKLPSGREICDEFRVSAITANRVLQNLANAGLVDRQPGRGNFLKAIPSSHSLARLHGARFDKLALVAPQQPGVNPFFDGFYSTIAERMVALAHEQNCDVRMLFMPKEEEDVPSLQKWIGTGTDGLIFFGVSRRCSQAAALALKAGMPAVFVDSYIEGWPCVVSDHVSAAIRIGRELSALGHRRIGYVGLENPGNNITNETERATVLPSVAPGLGMEVANRVIRDLDRTPDAVELLGRWIEKENVTAIVTSTYFSYQMTRELLRHGKPSLLDRLSFVGYDTWPQQPLPHTPPLSGTMPDRNGLGREAFDWLAHLAEMGRRPQEEGGKRVIAMSWEAGATLRSVS
jgi:DNA-binding LacI/PurR family transcriptional regulator